MLNSFWWGAKGPNQKGIRWMSWDRLTMRKEWGGMGFRSIHGFNLAMLGKQGWNFLTNPDAMVSRIFKAKYFPKGNFLGSSLGHNPSYVWRSIWSSRIVLREGHRWRLGDGSSIPIWNTPWLRDEQNPYITTPSNHQNAGYKVSELIDEEWGCWRSDLINNMFNARDAQLINQIPIVNYGTKDEVIWRFEKKGLYTVKSAYRVCVDVILDREDWKVEGDWNKLWALPIPPKVKHFMWKLGRDCLPNRQKLLCKGVDCQSNCVVCNDYLEDNWHLFLSCVDTVNCWRKINMWHKLDNVMQQATNFKDFFVKLWSNMDQCQLVSFAMTAWSLWHKRNVQLWEGKIETSDQVLARAQGVLQAWQQAQEVCNRSPSTRAQVQQVTWYPPPVNYVKCNIDAAIFSPEKKTSMGACVRNEDGQFITAMSVHTSAVMTPAEAEAWALQQGIMWMAMLGYRNVIFELDCKTVVDDIDSSKDNHSEYGLLIEDCKSMLSPHSNYVVAFTRRQANGSAHALARAALSHASRITFNYIPNYILTLIMNEKP
ncbi:Ribonuclease H superfamily protein [Trifolium repens]|nr:Ribonuclease H superfamily protein [Trifolium repens]